MRLKRTIHIKAGFPIRLTDETNSENLLTNKITVLPFQWDFSGRTVSLIEVAKSLLPYISAKNYLC